MVNGIRGRAIQVALTLLPIVINFKYDRKEWVRKEGKNVNEEKFRKHARKAVNIFINLGPSFIKLGQWLSTRADILPQPYLEEFAKLQDDVTPALFEPVRGIIEQELGPIEQIFDSFDTTCISGASMGQVYRARYKGREVIVKVNRPNIHEIVAKDIAVLKKLLPLGIRFVDKNIAFSAGSMFAQFIETVYEEMDYKMEAENLVRIKKNLSGETKVIIPNIYPDRSTSKVLTLEYVSGVKVTDAKKLDEMGIDKAKLVIRIHRLFFMMLLRHDIFHADPHPGNISVTENGSIILYDFGIVGRLDNETRLQLVRLYLSLLDKEPSRTVNVLLALGALSPEANRHVVEKGISFAIQELHGKKMDQMEVRAFMELANKTLTRFPFRLPKQLALYMRMASILEGIYLTLKVEFQFVKVLRSLLEEEGLMKEAYVEEVKHTFSRFLRSLNDSMTVTSLLKSYLENSNIINGKHSKNILISGSVLTSSVIIGSSIIMQSNPLWGQIGLIVSTVIMGVSIIMNRRR
ncbi:MAG: protein kinase [Thaumarchaeota archaeon]|nr:protein kinase [Nitrososphaerota archaeon]|tara:strand:+ start:2548 stop:4104 length:1557 start_codon:yes stop_codon:yes gene_type:complete